MRRFLLHIALFCAAFLPAYLLGIRLIGETPLHGNISYVPANYGHMRSRLAEADTIGPVDALFLGSSHCYRTFDPRVFAAKGIRIFNLGSSNQSLIQSYALLKRYKSTLTYNVLIIEVHPDIMGLDGVESACDLLSNMPWCRSLAGMVAELHHPRVINTAAYALMRCDNRQEDSIISVYHPVNGEQVMCDFAYVPGGYVELPCHRYQERPIAPRTIEFNDKQMRALIGCLSDNYRKPLVLLVEVPCTQTLYQAYTNHDEFEERMRKLEGFFPSTKYLNLNGKLPLVDSIHFFDEDHLNQEGAEMVCQYLRDSILYNYQRVCE